MKAQFLPAIAACGFLLMTSLADAKPLSRIIAEMGLSPADFEVVNATANTMLTSGTPSVGQERAWKNDDTGSKGTIRVQNVQGNCVSLQHIIQPEGGDQSREIRTRRCDDGNGNWILTP
ncbi:MULTISPECIES: hypothetical protein [unclassified Ruegeria]|uniref:hypothetical protein n=1 Tax=unclassified Ruegeria TaxID=2625375 RepID=UPI001489921E|nr:MULTISPECIES: hypothetical protein [unclassified Ruegeria]NOD77153.1 hypothetical protein [Ruegeria sp. HKCCD4332]NOD89624.1 hypothetical protein [Ruegeria sp. HKCCD4318]NOE13947.1 hypothetical protein [Ruegeria sp. HKCCD4318-2]NOG08116.1 hypothetical protein [Ruegeria sp. HKCCD4315]